MAQNDSLMPPPKLDGKGLRVGLVTARWNDEITNRLLQGAQQAIEECNINASDVVHVWVPGAFEVPLGAKFLIDEKNVDLVVGLGAVIRGETSHYDFVAGECARGLMDVQLITGVPVMFGVLTTENKQQALARSSDEDNKGYECLRGGVEMALLAKGLR